MSFLGTVKLHHAFAGTVFYVLLYAIHEKNYREIWFVNHVYKTGYSGFFELHQNSLNPLIVLSLDGQIACLNKAAANWFNVKVGERFEDSVPDGHNDKYLAQLTEAVNNATTTEE